jgi:hypothetical protein
MRRRGCADYQSLLDGAGARPLDHAARCSLGRALQGRGARRLCVGAADLRRRACQSFCGGYAGARSERQPAMYFPLGGGSLKGIGKPGEIVWSRVFVEGGALHADIGRGTVVTLPQGRDRAPLARDHAALADCAYGAAWREPESDDGSAPRQPREHCLCAFSGGCRQGSGDQGGDVCGAGVTCICAAMR